MRSGGNCRAATRLSRRLGGAGPEVEEEHQARTAPRLLFGFGELAGPGGLRDALKLGTDGLRKSHRPGLELALPHGTIQKLINPRVAAGLTNSRVHAVERLGRSLQILKEVAPVVQEHTRDPAGAIGIAGITKQGIQGFRRSQPRRGGADVCDAVQGRNACHVTRWKLPPGDDAQTQQRNPFGAKDPSTGASGASRAGHADSEGLLATGSPTLCLVFF